MAHLDELVDLLFQWSSTPNRGGGGHFDFDAVTAAYCDKLVSAPSHVFDGRASAIEGPVTRDSSAAWEEIKARERSAAATIGMDGVPLALRPR